MKVGKMHFPMKDTDLHRNLVWTELRDFYLEQLVWRGQRRIWDVRSGNNVLRQENCLAGAHWQTGLVEAIRRLKATMTPTALEHPRYGSTRMSRKSSGRLQCQRRCPGMLTNTSRFGKRTRSGRQILHIRVRGTTNSTS